MYREINDFPRLRLELLAAMSVHSAHDASASLISEIGVSFRRQMLLELPYGEPGPPGERRPSIRLWNVTMHESFDEPMVDIDEKEDAITSTVMFNHPSVGGGDSDVLDWFQFGTKPHQIPDTDTKVVFWWGPPLKWTQPAGMDEGIRSSRYAKHWGSPHVFQRGYWASPYGDFERAAHDTVRNEEEETVGRVYERSILIPLSGSQYLRRADK